MRYSFIILLVSALAALPARAQTTIITSLQQKVEGEGKVTIRQAPHIEALLGTRHTGEEEKIIKVPGYRVQVYAGNNSRGARDEAASMAARVKDYFPDVDVYTSFDPPRWICRVGNFLTIEEADAMAFQLKSLLLFKELFIVREQIHIRL
ncbi:hypothetical protein EZS27_012524 [termite gut metagenome]|uniref:SPOR domain-containing protein n=1 Tax=termite gut metagenome TaxID=433724 RepID=A0A5J4S212_9ZZZZ